MDFDLFSLGDVALQSGQILPEATLAYKTYGLPNADRSNVVLLPTFYTGTHVRNEAFFGPGRAVDPEKHFIISINMFGNGLSSSPTNAPAPADRGNFPVVTLYDNVTCQKKLLEEVLALRSCCSSTDGPWGGARLFNGRPSILNTLSMPCHFALRPAPPPTTASSSRESRPLSRPTPPLWTGFMTPPLRPD